MILIKNQNQLVVVMFGPTPCLPLLHILLCDWLRWNPPGTGDPPPRQALEVKLTTDRRVRAARVRHIVAVEWHHVTCDVTAGGGV